MADEIKIKPEYIYFLNSISNSKIVDIWSKDGPEYLRQGFPELSSNECEYILRHWKNTKVNHPSLKGRGLRGDS